MAYSTTTRDRIMGLYDQERALLNHDPDDWKAAEMVRTVCADIRAELAKLWPKARAEEVFMRCGPPRCLGGGTDRDQKRQFAHGIAPLPSGGD